MSDNSDDDFQAPTPLMENNDDDEPPAAGSCVVEFDTPRVTVSKAPTAEENHRANPKVPVTA